MSIIMSCQRFPFGTPFLALSVAFALGIVGSPCLRAQERPAAVADAGPALGAREAAPRGAFSIQAPAGWTIEKDEQKVSIRARESSGLALEAREVAYPGSAQSLADASMEGLANTYPDFKKISTDPFSTASGLKGVEFVFEHRLKAGGPMIRQVIFFMDGRPGHKVFATCGILAERFTPEVHELYRRVAGSIQAEVK